MKTQYVVVFCMCAFPLLCWDKQPKQSPASQPGMVNDDPTLRRQIGEAAGKAEEVKYIYQSLVWGSENEEELDQAEEFYDQQVVPAEIERLKRESRKHSFDYSFGFRISR